MLSESSESAQLPEQSSIPCKQVSCSSKARNHRNEAIFASCRFHADLCAVRHVSVGVVSAAFLEKYLVVTFVNGSCYLQSMAWCSFGRVSTYEDFKIPWTFAVLFLFLLLFTWVIAWRAATPTASATTTSEIPLDCLFKWSSWCGLHFVARVAWVPWGQGVAVHPIWQRKGHFPGVSREDLH